jgi:GR25 family glycosyltransferase involved in LPS biosynthesis
MVYSVGPGVARQRLHILHIQPTTLPCELHSCFSVAQNIASLLLLQLLLYSSSLLLAIPTTIETMETNKKQPGEEPRKSAYVPPHRRRQPSLKDTKEQPNNSNETADLSILDNALTYIRCINLKERPDKYEAFCQGARKVNGSFARKIQRFDAIVGASTVVCDTVCQISWDNTKDAQYNRKVTPGIKNMSSGEVGCALSHVELWKVLAAAPPPVDLPENSNQTMLILEDDAILDPTSRGAKSRFAAAFAQAWKQLAVDEDWGILYLGFSARGERTYIESAKEEEEEEVKRGLKVQLYRPEYGYHTHAYVITQTAARTLLEECLPVVGPIDVWLADNQWFGLPVYCAVIDGEGWKNAEGRYEGAPLVGQHRGRGTKSDIVQSSEVKYSK